MFKTKVTEKLGIEHPILGGTMMWLSVPKLVAATSEAGALGILASATYRSKEAFREAVQETKALTKKPFGVNINLFPAMKAIPNEDYIEVILDEGVRVVETSGHKAPEDLIEQLKEGGCTLMHKCVGVRYARKAESLGVDMVTVVGWENGGATGVLDISTLALVPRVVDSVNIPVIAGGGVGDGRGMLAILALGAEGIIIGTRLLVSEECPIHMNLKEALCKANETDTMLILRSIGNTHRVWKNDQATKIAEAETRGLKFEDLAPMIKGENNKAMFDTGDLHVGILSCGQGIGLATEIKPVADIIAGIVNEAVEMKNRLGEITR